MSLPSEFIKKYCNDLYLSKDLVCDEAKGVCAACGAFGPYEFREVINPVLAKQWKLSSIQQHSMSARESMYCAFCGCSYRLRQLARAVSDFVAGNANNLQQNIASGSFQKYKVAEINSCGVLHEILKGMPDLIYSEYGAVGNNIPNEDIQQLTYKDSSFDIVLTSDTLEHVPDTVAALRESFRILKPGGAHIMTIPLLLDRKTRHRAELGSGGKAKNLLSESFHGAGQPDYLVWHEFGTDLLDTLFEIGFEVTLLYQNLLRSDDECAGVVIAQKPKTSRRRQRNKIVYVTTNLQGNSIFNSLGLSSIDFERKSSPVPVIDLSWQAERVTALRYKLTLTEDHVRNIEDALSYYRQMTNELEVRLTEAKERIRKLESLPIVRHILRIKRR